MFWNGPVTKSPIAIVRRPPGPWATTWPPSAVITAAQSPCGSAWHSEPTSVPRVRTIGSAIRGAAAVIVGCRSARTVGVLEVGMAAQRTDVQGAVVVDPVVGEVGQVVDVDQQLGRGEAQLEQGHQALAAGQHLGLTAALVEQRDRLGDAAGCLVAEARREHSGLLLVDGMDGGAGPGCGGRADSGSGTATGPESIAVGSGRGSWCGGHGPCTGWPATFR